MRRAAAVLVVFASLTTCTAVAPRPAAAAERVRYHQPVEGRVVDPFRAPRDRYAAGNRGVDVATVPGALVRAAADGVVAFAGPVAGARHVVVLHPDGLRTTYSFLAAVRVRRGQRVRAGHPVGTSAGVVHLGIRAGDTYLDPRPFWRDDPPAVHLVPAEREMASEAHERSALAKLGRAVGATVRAGKRIGETAYRWVDAGVDATGDAFDAVAQRLLDEVQELCRELSPALDLTFAMASGVVEAVRRWRQECTPDDVTPPPAPKGHVLVLVGGLNSSAARGRPSGTVTRVDPRALGYDADHVVEFSYAGGTVAEAGYTAHDTHKGLRESGDQLRALLVQLQAQHPGVPVDIVAHSQGGLVSRSALAHVDGVVGKLPSIASLTTLSTPHQGADLATVSAELRRAPAGELAAAAIGAISPMGLDPRAPAIRDLAEGSRFLTDLNEQALPRAVRVTSVGARGDVVVPTPKTRLDGARHVVVPVIAGGGAHDGMVGAAVTRREVALSIAGMPPTCETLLDALADETVGAGVTFAEDRLEDLVGRLGDVAFPGLRGPEPAPSAPLPTTGGTT